MGWKRVAEEIIKRRVELGLNSREAFARDSGLSSRLLSDIENGRRQSYDPATLVRLERALRWVPGSVTAILDGGHPTPMPDEPVDLERPTGDWDVMMLIARSGLPRRDMERIIALAAVIRDGQRHELAEAVRRLIADAGGAVDDEPTSPGAPRADVNPDDGGIPLPERGPRRRPATRGVTGGA